MDSISILSILGLVTALGIYLVRIIRRRINFFSDRNIPYLPILSTISSDIEIALSRRHMATKLMESYEKLAPHKIGGIFVGLKPILIVRDPEYVNRIYKTDFSYFVDRGYIVDEKKDPLDGHLFFLSGEKWKYLRSKLSPAFSSAKLKWMFEQMKICSDKFVSSFVDGLDLKEEVDLRLTFKRYSIDIITSCVFGVDANAIGDSDCIFKKMGHHFFTSKKISFLFLMRLFAPQLLTTLKIKTVDSSMNEFFVNFAKQTFDHRLSTNFIRKDFVQILLELRENGWLNDLPGEQPEKQGQTIEDGVVEMTDAIYAAQMFVFFLAGYESSSTTIFSTIYFLACNPDCQRKARDEAKRVKEKHGDFTYESAKELYYIQCCFDETLRMIPPVAMNTRVATKDYTFPDGSTIEKDTLVLLPTLPLQYDPEFYPDPHKFDPERFAGRLPNKGTYAPFGDGPRMCIGKRFAEAAMKLALTQLLLEYKFLPAEKEADLLDYEAGLFISVPKITMKVRIEKI